MRRLVVGTGADGILLPEVAGYLEAITPPAPGVLGEMEEEARAQGFPIVGPMVGRLLWQLVAAGRSRMVLEMGSGFGYSTAWLAMAVGPGGLVVGSDRSPTNLERARAYLGRMGLLERVELHLGDALELARAEERSFDLVFIDVDKVEYPAALEVGLPRLRPGGFLVCDNTLWSGDVARPRAGGEAVRAIREFNRRIFEHPDLLSLILPLRDGVAVCHRLR